MECERKDGLKNIRSNERIKTIISLGPIVKIIKLSKVTHQKRKKKC